MAALSAATTVSPSARDGCNGERARTLKSRPWRSWAGARARCAPSLAQRQGGTRGGKPNDSIEISLAAARRVRRVALAPVPAAVGSWRDTERFGRDGTRGAPSIDPIEISGPQRAWAGDDRASAQAHLLWRGRSSGAANASRPPTIKLVVTRANAQVQLRTSQIKAHAKHAQSLDRSSAATFVRRQARFTQKSA